MVTSQTTLLAIKGLSVEFPGVKALEQVDVTLQRGEIMALLGENGAGKSTLIKALTGVYQRSAGEILLEGTAIAPQSTAQAQLLGIGTVYQEVNLLPNISVAANLFIGREPTRFGLVDQKAAAPGPAAFAGVWITVGCQSAIGQLLHCDPADYRYRAGGRLVGQSSDPG